MADYCHTCGTEPQAGTLPNTVAWIERNAGSGRDEVRHGEVQQCRSCLRAYNLAAHDAELAAELRHREVAEAAYWAPKEADRALAEAEYWDGMASGAGL